MHIPDIRNNSSKVQLIRIGHVYFEYPDLERFASFAQDFGFVEAERKTDRIYYRGYGRDPYVLVASKSNDGKARFKGPAFVAQSESEYKKAANIAGAREWTLDGPGGGKMVTFEREDDTYFSVIYGQQEREVPKDRPPTETQISQGPFNYPYSKPRKGTFQRYHDGPALVNKLGHFGYVHRFFDQEFQWYTSNFNFVPSDILHSRQNPDVDVLTFLHLDLGMEYSDHHSFFLARAPPDCPKTYLHHTSYEVEDFDTQLMGHQFLAKQGWEAVWGVGRHILGSQIFDYWHDPAGFKIEHYADGDVVNHDHVTTREEAGPVSIWGPEMPKTFNDDDVLKFGFS